VTLRACTKRQTFTKPNAPKFDTGLGTIVHYSSGCKLRGGTLPELRSALNGTMVIIADEPLTSTTYNDTYLAMSFDGARWHSTTVYMYDHAARQYHYCDNQLVRKGVLVRRAAAAAS
jgi:hypothetical protein